METIAALVSAKEKLRTLKQLALLSDMAKECADSKKTLRLLKTLTKNRQKSFAHAKAPLTDADSQGISVLFNELCGMLKQCKQAKTVEEYNLAAQALRELHERLLSEIAATEAAVQSNGEDKPHNELAAADLRSCAQFKKKNPDRKKLQIGVVFSGGVSKCAYQIGFVKALLQYIDRSEIKVISGASLGMFNAYALAADKLDLMEQMYRNIDIRKKSELIKQVCVHHLLSDYLNGLVCVDDNVTIPMCFPVCHIPLLATKYYWMYKAYNPAWKKYMLAGATFPFLSIFPSWVNKRFAIDGGAVDNIPLYPLLKSGTAFLPTDTTLDLILVLHFDSRFDYRTEFSSHTPILDIDVAICNHFKKNHFDFSAAYMQEMLATAEEYGAKIGAKLFSGDCSRENLQKNIDEIFLAEHERRQQQMSADRLVSTLNVIGKALRKDSNCMKNLF